MASGAVLAFDDRCRLLLERGDGPRTAVWLMCNPSTADARQDDPTIRRCRHFSARAACDRLLVVNVWAWRATDPAILWAALARGGYTPEMHAANLDVLTMAGAQAERDRRVREAGLAFVVRRSELLDAFNHLA